MYRLKTVETKEDWKRFIELPWAVYKNDLNWVPPLRIAIRDILDVNKNPFFRHAYMHPVLVVRGDECVGRIVGIIDENHNRFHGEKTGFFGFFESINDQGVSDLLFSETKRWLKSRGMETVRGPVNPSTNHECGLLVEGFSDSPSVMMTYNPSYYIELIENWGFQKSKDLYAYALISNSVKFSERLEAHAARLRERGNITFRTIDLRDFDGEVSRILDIYNDAWEDNWGFVPMDEEEFRHMASDLKLILDPNLLLIAEVKGKAVGFGLTLPDVNQALKRIPDGRLFPFGLFKLLWNLKGPGRRRNVRRCRILTLGIKKTYRELGIGPLFYTEYKKRGRALGYDVGECSWILEDNRQMNRALEMMGAERTKTYRIYDRSLLSN